MFVVNEALCKQNATQLLKDLNEEQNTKLKLEYFGLNLVFHTDVETLLNNLEQCFEVGF